MVDSSARNRTNCFLTWSPSFLFPSHERITAIDLVQKSKIKWTAQLYLNLAKKKKKKDKQGATNAKRIPLEMESKWNFTNGLCTLTLGKVYPQFLVEETHHLYCVDSSSCFWKGAMLVFWVGEFITRVYSVPCALPNTYYLWLLGY